MALGTCPPVERTDGHPLAERRLLERLGRRAKDQCRTDRVRKARRRARAVVTNFFHGCVFSLLYGKPWVTAPSEYRSIKIPDLASLLGVQSHVVDEQVSAASVAELLDTPMTPEVARRLQELRGRSEAYLHEALS